MKQVIAKYDTVLSTFEIKNRGTVYVVRAEKDREDFSDLLGSVVIIKDKRYNVKGVERMGKIGLTQGQPLALLTTPNGIRHQLKPEYIRKYTPAKIKN